MKAYGSVKVRSLEELDEPAPPVDTRCGVCGSLCRGCTPEQRVRVHKLKRWATDEEWQMIAEFAAGTFRMSGSG